ncbi:MAG: hypothetical protein AAFV53_04300 [Myxococcota bacterium]
MRAMVGCVLMMLTGCAEMDPSATIEMPIFHPRAPLGDVKIAGQIDRFNAHTRTGWGEVVVWEDGQPETSGFAVDVRGEAQGVIMARVTVHGALYAALRPGDRFTVTPEFENPNAVKVNGIVCGGDEDGDWDIDIGPEGGVFEVLDRDGDFLNVAMDLWFAESDVWAETFATLPVQVN